MNCAAFLAVHTTGTDTGKNGCKLPPVQRAISGYPSSSTSNKPEDQLFVSCIQKERNTQVSAALNGIVKIIKAQNFSVFFVKKSSG
ncbi:hypothetical protein OIU92_31665 [Escherichia coli]|nr:hypothetical protein [Escherichia coli]